ncbi:hypothetical protein [Flavobacterium cerinum]|uniref:Uncharacterized protein n=1 Tax=Flavobacterium cerinum TaxID=2502784 RepID=A0ABY5IW61_9FLAO|nr:hypothetical protein [Flavobacterium cerinum]UUC47078.1 hypothetical protein NOX80_07725 [Flavobacterium cerinum]
MKKITFYAMTLFVSLVTSTVFAQSTAQQNLNNAIQSAENIQQDTPTAKGAAIQLAKQIAILNAPNAQQFYNAMFTQVASVQNNSDDVDYFVNEARTASQNAFSTAGINAITAELVNLNDILIGLTYQINDALAANDNTTALNLIPNVKSVLDKQYTTTNDLIDAINSVASSIKTYNVCIKLVDYLGNPVTYNDLHGYYAYNQSNAYFYPENYGDCYDNLAPGTYTFAAYNGYFSGASSTTVTLSDSLVNANGIIEVTLVYWSE